MGLPPEKTAAELDETQAYRSVDGELPQGEVRINLAPPGPSGEAQARYEEGPLLGRGGMGEVVLQLDRRIGRHVARKTLRADVPAARPRFLREARVQGQLEHPSVVPVYDLGVSPDGAPFFTMKRVRGQSLGQILEHLAGRDAGWAARFSRRKLLSAFVQVCLAVEYAHKRGVLHRDLKPENIMLGDFGEVYVLDWGLARLVGEPADPESESAGPRGESAVRERPGGRVTRAGDILGTPMYMAPEQFGVGPGTIGPRSDVFGLGAILFEILTLSPYRVFDSFETLLASMKRAQVERPSERAGGVPPELDEACVRALAADPAGRLASALDLAEPIERFLEGERDQAARQQQAARLLASIRERLAGAARDAGARVEAMRGALQALALAPDDAEAQKMLLSLVVDGSGSLPPAAEREFEAGALGTQIKAVSLASAVYASWLLGLPVSLWFGIRHWTMPLVIFSLVVVLLGHALTLRAWLRRRQEPLRGQVLPLATLTFTMLSMLGCWLGPFVVVPLTLCGTMVVFLVNATTRERPWLIGMACAAMLAPFGVELLGVLPPAFTFEGGDLVLHARSLALPEGPTIAVLAYLSLTWVLQLGVSIGHLRDQQDKGDRRLFLQSWYVRQLFPSREPEPAAPRPAAASPDARSGPGSMARVVAATPPDADSSAYRSMSSQPSQAVQVDEETLSADDERARYEEGPLLGRGGMGEVVLQLDRRIGRHVARKTLRTDAPSAHALARFLREVRVQGQLEHPSVVPVYDLGVSPDGAPFFTMKRVRGQSLGQILEHLAGRDAGWAARFSRRKLLSAFVQVCLAVEYAHKRGVLHRDLKPENIMLGDFGEVYVLDWGLAKLVGEPADVADEGAVQEPIAPGIQVTRAGDILGTPRYMAPEQFGATRGALGPHSDVFGLGAILFEILTLSPYRAADSLSNLLLREVGRQAERPSTRAADVPPDLDDACVRALSLEPGDRGSALALAAALESYLEGDREQATREALARELLDAAAGNLARGDAGARVEAMRGALQALALTPDDAGAQKMLLSLVIDGSGSLPPAAEREFAEAHIPSRIEGMRFGLLGCLIWIVMFPSTLLLGVRDWTVLVLCLVLALASAVYLWTRLQASKRDPTKHYGHPIALALVIGLVISLNSAWLGPFILTPLNGSAAMVFFVFHSTRAERPWIIAILTLAVIAPFGVEFLHLFPPAYTFRGGDLVLHARSLALPEGPTTAMLAFGVCFLVVIGSFVGRIRDRKQQREREMFVQGWHLRQLFPRSSGETRGP